MATIKDVAELAGVSFTTVSHVLNNTRVVSPQTKARVLEAIEKLHFEVNAVARGLRRGETKTVGVVSTTSVDPFFAEVLHGVQEEAWAKEFGVYISYSELCETSSAEKWIHQGDKYVQREISLLEDLSRRGIQGLVLNSLQPDPVLLTSLAKLKIPCVLYQRHIEGAHWDCFLSDDYQGSSLAMDHLIGLGHRKIALIHSFGYDSHTVKFRKAAWADKLKAIGVTPDPAYLHDGRFDMEEAYKATLSLLRSKNRPTAIFYYSDSMAFAGLCAASEAGFRVPQDVSVIGYDNRAEGNYSVPRLTSVNQMTHQVGSAMVDRLFERMADPDLAACVRVFGQDLVVRNSTGPVPL